MLEGGDLDRAEIRLKEDGPSVSFGKRREQFAWNRLPGKIPDHGAELILFVKTNTVIYGKKLMCIVLKKDMAAFAVSVVDEQVKEHDRFEQFPVFRCEVKVMIFHIVVDILLKRAASVRAIFA